jgi:hypothetical protein
MCKLVITAIIITLIILAVWGLYGIIKKDLKPVAVTAKCKVGMTCKIEGKTFLMISEVGK